MFGLQNEFTSLFYSKGSLVALFNGVRKREVIGIIPEMSDYKIGTVYILGQ